MGMLWDRNAAVVFGVRGEQGTRVENLRIAFNIVKTSESNTNASTIVIYNLKLNKINKMHH